MVSVGVAFDGRNPMPALLEQARAAEAGGAGSFWVASHLFLRDPFSMAAAILGATTRSRVVLMAVSPHVMHPVHIAMGAATLDEMAPGRVVVCLGTGAPGDLAGVAVEPVRRIRTLREAVEITRRLLGGEQVHYRGERFRVEGRSLNTGRRAVPVFLAASAAQSLALAGEVADGVVLSAATSIPFVRWTLEHVGRGANGRRLHRAGLVYAAVADRAADAYDRFRGQLAITLRGEHHAANLRMAGASLDQDAVRRAVNAEDLKTAEALVSDDVVRRHTASGTPAQVREQLAAYEAAGLDEVVLAGLYDPAETTRTLQAVMG
jgi:5,10-methylenetetrahydromethanopterin reductase